eukprot:7323401-Prymnesium_polylepis.1
MVIWRIILDAITLLGTNASDPPLAFERGERADPWEGCARAFGAAPQGQRPRGLVAFTLVRGGASDSDYVSFLSSRRCLRDSMPSM